MPGDAGTRTIFATRTGSPLSNNNVRRTFREFLEIAGLADAGISLRSYRRTGATVIARSIGTDAAAVFLGHTSTAITEGHYIEPDRAIDITPAAQLERTLRPAASDASCSPSVQQTVRTHCSTPSTARAPMRRRRAETAGPQRAREAAPGPDVALSIDPIRLSHGWLESSPPSDLRILSLWARFRRSRRSCRISMAVAARSVVAAASAFPQEGAQDGRASSPPVIAGHSGIRLRPSRKGRYGRCGSSSTAEPACARIGVGMNHSRGRRVRGRRGRRSSPRLRRDPSGACGRRIGIGVGE